MDKQQILEDFEKEFRRIKKELKFKARLDDLDQAFFLRDAILTQGYVSPTLSRQICYRMCDTYNSWVNHFHSILFPATYNLVQNTEASFFTEKEKAHLVQLMNTCIFLIRKNSLAGIKKDKKIEAAFIDEALRFWQHEFKPYLILFSEKTYEGWKNFKNPVDKIERPKAFKE